ncbi:976_t:CDS:2 [Funneliformis mosseae]|uniref:GDP-mannose transporter n=1 Tax=Funneliformis mosseae TaxID=27381 RepID=A0A9N8YKU1_FUNMO|nr:976_t:CDS:2 [Funneliformis mosseae]
MSQPPAFLAFLTATGTLPILTYCAASILMTVTNKYVLSGYEFNMNFLLLGVQEAKEVLWFGGNVSRLTMTSFLLMVFSSIIAAISDSSKASVKSTSVIFDLGYLWMAFNCISSAAFVLTMRKHIKSTNFKDFDTVYYNNLLSIPLLMIMSLMMEDWSSKNFERNLPEDMRNTLIMAILFSGISAFGISYTSAWCVRVTSSTTYSMVGALNKLPIAASGMIFFGDPITIGNVSGIFVGFVAGILYSIAKTEQQKPTKPLYIPLSNELPKTANGDNTSIMQSNPINNNTVINIEGKKLLEKM